MDSAARVFLLLTKLGGRVHLLRVGEDSDLRLTSDETEPSAPVLRAHASVIRHKITTPASRHRGRDQADYRDRAVNQDHQPRIVATSPLHSWSRTPSAQVSAWMESGRYNYLSSAPSLSRSSLTVARVHSAKARGRWPTLRSGTPSSSTHLSPPSRAPAWQEFLDAILLRTASGLHIDGGAASIRPELYKLLVYEMGGHFHLHRDSEKAPGTSIASNTSTRRLGCRWRTRRATIFDASSS